MDFDNTFDYIANFIVTDGIFLAFSLFILFWVLYTLYLIIKWIYINIHNCYARNYNRKIYKKIVNIHNIEISENEICCICLEDYSEDNVVGTLPCNHDFHDKCISTWFDEKYTCPLCQKGVALREVLVL